VLCDPKLSAYAKCVYGVMALNVFQGNVAKIGQRLIANKLGINKDTVCKAVAELVERKHIGVIGKGRQRRWYSLLSAVYAQKQRAGVEEVVSAPSGGHRLATVAKKRA
jgi:DNA-binding IclR family transcriptional regulator